MPRFLLSVFQPLTFWECFFIEGMWCEILYSEAHFGELGCKGVYVYVLYYVCTTVSMTVILILKSSYTVLDLAIDWHVLCYMWLRE